jgi:spore coat polysaccharide biosynthesis protein SpsF
MNLAIVIQARFSSVRLPGKVLAKVSGKPLLDYLLERVQRCRTVSTIILATSQERDDEAIAAWCLSRGIACQRGPLANVAERFRQVCEKWKLDAFVRINGDSPMIDPALIDQAVDLFCKTDADLATNVQKRSYPKGESVEVVKSTAFSRAMTRMTRPDELEHVTPYFYEHPADFHIENFRADQGFEQLRLAVDTPEDLTTFTGVIHRMNKPHWEYGWKDLLPLYKEAALTR